jgi:hypothetical protein
MVPRLLVSIHCGAAFSLIPCGPAFSLIHCGAAFSLILSFWKGAACALLLRHACALVPELVLVAAAGADAAVGAVSAAASAPQEEAVGLCLSHNRWLCRDHG